MEVNKEYWASDLPLPLSPSDKDIKIYQKYMTEGTSLLLGCTKKLIPITDFQMDIDPWYGADTVIKQDWLTNETYYDNILGDGVLNFNQDFTEKIVEMASKNCKVFIARSFAYKIHTMRIANNFPLWKDFTIRPDEVKIINGYYFYVWRF
jgi:hypothetical protein